MKPLRWPSVAAVFGDRAHDAEAAIAVDPERRTPEQRALAVGYTMALIQSVARRLRGPDATPGSEPRRPSTAWLRQ